MSPEWIPLLFAAALIAVLLLMLRSREQSRRVTICRIVVMETIYLGKALLGSLIVAAVAGAIPNRYYRRMAREK